MLQFWKKSGQSENCYPSTNKTTKIENCTKQSSFESNKSCPILHTFDDEGLCDLDEMESSPRERSRLSKTLQEVLSDKSALTYFLQYMESRNASRYILCWLDIESFKGEMLQCRKPNFSPVPNQKVDHDSLSVSTDCDSLTADTNSLNDYSTATISGSECRVTIQSSHEACDRDLSDISPKLKSLDEISLMNELQKRNNQHAIDNALIIFKKYIAQEADHNIKCSDFIRNEFIENICDIDKVLTGNCFSRVQNFIFETMEKEFFDAFLGSDYFCKHQIDVLTSGNVVLDDILHNETALFYFMEFLEQENCRSLLEFWIAATNLQQQLNDQKEFFDPIEAQNDAVVLYDKYFSLQAHCPLGFNDKIRFQVEQNICGEHGLVLDCFSLPLKLVEQILEKNYLKPFLASQLFYKYLSELINSVQACGYSMNIENNKHSPSDCSSERSFSTNSTFLALEIHQNNCYRKNNKTNMSIDTRLLCDPDSLWKRRRTHLLSCGRVTALGKFETDLEPEPDRNSFKLKNVVKKFVSLDEDKKKEDMAWQVAEMIVKDITRITLNQQDKQLKNS